MSVIRLILFFSTIQIFAPTPVLAETTPTDVFHMALQLEADVNLVRLEIGVSELSKVDIAVANAQPREVYFQAITLLEKSNRLLFEHLRERTEIPLAPSDDIAPEHVLLLVNKAFVNLSKVKRFLNITESVNKTPITETKTPTDVFKLIVSINRSLNTLLMRDFEPADVYQNLTAGISLSHEILVTLQSQNPLGSDVAFVRRKTPTDVYRKLLQLYSIVEDICARSSRQCLTIDPVESQRVDVTPSDVHDLASLLVAGLSYLHSQTNEAGSPKSTYYPGKKLPSHVFQRAGRLESQLEMLRDYVVINPDWLGPE